MRYCISPLRILFILVLTTNTIIAQNKALDSLFAKVEETKGEAKAAYLTEICQKYWYKAPLEAIKYGKQAVEVAKEAGAIKQIANSKSSLGYAYNVYGDYPSALELMLEALHEFEKLSLEANIANVCNNIGTVYVAQKNYKLAAQYFERSLEFSKKNGKKLSVAQGSTNLGVVNMRLGNHDEALQLHQVYEDYGAEVNDALVIAIAKGNKADVYRAMEDVENAKKLYEESLELSKKINDTEGIILMSMSLSEIFLNEGKIAKSRKLGEKALEYSRVGNFISYQKDALKLLSNIARIDGKSNLALRYHDEYMILKDSIFSEESAEKIARLQNSYETAKKELEIKEKELEIELLNRDKKIQFLTTAAISGVLLIILFLGGLLWRALQKTTAQNALLAQQKSDLEQYKEEILAQREAIKERNVQLAQVNDNINRQHKRITDSIQYAKRIQNAILPSGHRIRQIEAITDHFILFRPKDVVSGDFYWVSELNNKIIIAVADCTGHGVPGAFMSMIGNDLLNEIIYHRHIYEPATILARLDESVRFTLHKDNPQTKDGMDIGVCVIDTQEKVLRFAGAKIPLLVSDLQDGEYQLVKPDKGAIGGKRYTKEAFFNAHQIPLDSPKRFYLFSDGFQDQFGGGELKKFMRKNLCQQLHDTRNLPMSEQKTSLFTTLESWIGKNKQTDDIVVWGFQIG